MSEGEASRDPIHFATGTVTALPTIFHLDPGLTFLPESGSRSVQSAGNPCRRSASRISGVKKHPLRRSHTAGGEGIPIAEPPFKVGTPFIAQPRPSRPSVHEKPQGTSPSSI